MNVETFTVCQWTVYNADLTDKLNIEILGRMNWLAIICSELKHYIEKSSV